MVEIKTYLFRYEGMMVKFKTNSFINRCTNVYTTSKKAFYTNRIAQTQFVVDLNIGIQVSFSRMTSRQG